MAPTSFSSPVTLAAITFAASFVLGFPVCTLLRRQGVVDKPNLRSSHDRPTVRGGGIASVAVITLGTFLMCSAAVPAASSGSVSLPGASMKGNDSDPASGRVLSAVRFAEERSS